jgi:hypothetical protein
MRIEKARDVMAQFCEADSICIVVFNIDSQRQFFIGWLDIQGPIRESLAVSVGISFCWRVCLKTG